MMADKENLVPAYETPLHGFRTFIIMWATQSLSFIGSTLTLFAANIWLAQTLYPRPEQKPALGLALSATSLAYAIPAVFGAPLAGAWVDRHDRKRTMLVADLAGGFLCVVLVMLLATGVLRLWTLLLLLIFYSGFGSYHYAAFDTSYAMLVPERLLPRANGMMQTMQSLAFLFAPALAAILISLPALGRQGVLPGAFGAAIGHLSSGTALAIAVDGATFFAIAAVLVFLRIPSPMHLASARLADQPRQSMWGDVQVGIRYIWHRRPLLWLLTTFAVANLMGQPVYILQPLLVKFNLAGDWSSRGFRYESALAFLSTALGVGGVAGGIVVSAWGGLKARRVYGVVIPMLVQGLATIVFGLSPWLYFSAGMAFMMAFMGPVLNAHSQTIWQTQTPRELQGRVFAVRRLIAQGTLPLAAALASFGSLFNVGAVIAVCGVIIAGFCALQLFNPSLRRVDDKAWLEELAAQVVARNG
jgi:DHA3 family macrolide efflux protein-like MFS transporter